MYDYIHAKHLTYFFNDCFGQLFLTTHFIETIQLTFDSSL